MTMTCSHCAQPIPQRCDGKVFQIPNGALICRGSHRKGFVRNWYGELMFKMVYKGRRRTVKLTLVSHPLNHGR